MANLEAHAGGGGGESRHIEIFWNLITWHANYLSWFNCSLHPQLRKKLTNAQQNSNGLHGRFKLENPFEPSLIVDL
jgi:hypothetical protein